MNPEWLKLAGDLLELASQKFSNHGCNDWKWPADWTQHERQEFATAMVSRNVRRSVDALKMKDRDDIVDLCRGKYGPPDWWVMAFLADHLKESKS